MSASSWHSFEPSKSRTWSRAWMSMERSGRYITQLWTDSYHDIQDDIRSASWIRGSLWFLAFCWTSCLPVLLFWLNVPGVFTVPSSGIAASACRPDGTFSLYPSLYNAWATSGFFQITLGSGPYSFTTAKVIDVFWDILVGRGGQALLAYLSWRVFSKYITTSMEVASIKYKTFSIIFLQKGPSVTSLFHIIRDFVFTQDPISKTAMVFIVASMTFVLGFPTFASAMSGYSGIIKAYVPGQDGNFIPFSDFAEVLYIIHDGWRINYTGEYPVIPFLGAAQGELDPSYGYWRWSYCVHRQYSTAFGYDPSLHMPGCYLQNNVSDYVSTYGFFGLNNTESTFMAQSLPAPVLNISAFYRSDPSIFGLDNWTDPRTHQQAFNNKSKMVWTVAQLNQTYNCTYISRNGLCQPLTTYQWGFSFLQLHLVVILLLIWITGIYIMWLKTSLIMRQRGRNEVAGEYKAVLELAAAMHHQFGKGQEDPLALTERELSQRIKKRLNGGTIAYEVPIIHGKFSFRKDSIDRIKREKWWLAAALISCTLFSVGWMLNFTFFLFMLFAFCGIVYAMIVGRRDKFRFFLTFCWCVLGVVMAVSIGATSEVPMGIKPYFLDYLHP